MAALVLERADAAGQADQRRVRGEHVAQPHLGLREVQDREPAGPRQRDQRDDEADREGGPDRGDEPPRGPRRRRIPGHVGVVAVRVVRARRRRGHPGDCTGETGASLGIHAQDFGVRAATLRPMPGLLARCVRAHRRRPA